ncbi:MAG: SCP2 sterol-binding domain-containing protein [Sulfolobales archaeon]
MNSSIVFPSREWAEEYCRVLNESSEYRDLGRGWVWPILFIVTELPPDLRSQYPSGNPGFIADLYNGECRGVKFYDDASSVDAPFILSARYRDWLDILSGRETPVSAMLKRKLILRKGDMAAVLRYAYRNCFGFYIGLYWVMLFFCYDQHIDLFSV